MSASVTPLFCTVTVHTLVRVSGSVNFGSLGENVLVLLDRPAFAGRCGIAHGQGECLGLAAFQLNADGVAARSKLRQHTARQDERTRRGIERVVDARQTEHHIPDILRGIGAAQACVHIRVLFRLVIAVKRRILHISLTEESVTTMAIAVVLPSESVSVSL